MDYKDMLKRARDNMPESAKNRERFEIPKVKGHVQGNKTIVNNIHQISQLLGRDSQVLFKYILKELATPGVLENQRAVFGRKLNSNMINERIHKFADSYVICPECGKPETKIEKSEGDVFLRCMACGAKTPVKGWVY